MSLHPNYPPNLTVAPEPAYEVVIVYPDGTKTRLAYRDRTTWQRQTAITHARYWALRYADCQIHVDLT